MFKAFLFAFILIGWLSHFPLAFALSDAESVPSWYGGEAQCADCVYKFGSSQGTSEAESLQQARIDAYKSLAEDYFGIGLDVQVKQATSNKGTQYAEQSSGYIEIKSLPSDIIKKETRKKTESVYEAFVQVKFLKADIEKEKQRQKQYAETAFSNRLKTIEHAQHIGRRSELTGGLVLKGVPDNAEVFLDKELITKGEAGFPNVGAGQYTLKVTHPDFHPLTGNLNIEPGQRTVIEVNMVPYRGEVFIETLPAGAVVDINGSIQGRTPFQTTLRAGEYHLLLDKQGYQKRKLKIDVPADKRATYKVKLVAE